MIRDSRQTLAIWFVFHSFFVFCMKGQCSQCNKAKIKDCNCNNLPPLKCHHWKLHASNVHYLLLPLRLPQHSAVSNAKIIANAFDTQSGWAKRQQCTQNLSQSNRQPLTNHSTSQLESEGLALSAWLWQRKLLNFTFQSQWKIIK